MDWGAGICKDAQEPPAGMQGWDMLGTYRHAGVGLTGLVLGLGMAPHSCFGVGKGIIYGCVP